MQATTQRGMTMCFAPLDDIAMDARDTIEPLAVVDGGFQYPADPLERLLDKYCVEGQLSNVADLAEVADDRGEFVEVVCRVRKPSIAA